MEERVINLRKERTISLVKRGVSGKEEKLEFVRVGLKWGRIQKGGRQTKTVTEETTVYTGNAFQKLFKIGPKEIKTITKEVSTGFGTPTYENVDLDASILVYDSSKRCIDTLYYGHLTAGNDSLWHSTDDVHGSNDAESEKDDNEVMTIDFKKLPENFKYMVVILNSYRHHRFDALPYATMNIYESQSSGIQKKLFAEYRLDNNPEFIGKEALVLGGFYKEGGVWRFKACGISTTERSISEITKGSAQTFVKSELP